MARSLHYGRDDKKRLGLIEKTLEIAVKSRYTGFEFGGERELVRNASRKKFGEQKVAFAHLISETLAAY